MKRLFLILILLLFTTCLYAEDMQLARIGVGTAGGGVAAAGFACALDASYTAGANETLACFDAAGSQWCAAQFTTGAGVTSVCQIDVDVYKVNSPTMDMAVHIFADSGSNTPTGASLGNSASINTSTLPAAIGTYTTFVVTVTGLTAATKYWIALRGSATSGINCIKWGGADATATGQRATSADTAGAPASWSNAGTRSYHWKTYQNNK